MRGVHYLKVWTKKQQVVSLSTVESELSAAVKTASDGPGIQILCGLSVHLDASERCAWSIAEDWGKTKKHLMSIVVYDFV